jgi:N6-L-threonylcarbamoyladenine synthase
VKEINYLIVLSEKKVKLPISTDGGFFNFSGLETKAVGMLLENNIEDVAKGVFEAISETLKRSLEYVVKATGIKNILIAGGVASNNLIRNNLSNEFGDNIYFASPELSCDNGVGIALCTKRVMEERGL